MSESPTAVDVARRLADAMMMFFRRKDLADVEAVLRNPPSGLDVDAVRSKLVELVGKDDERVREWDAILRDVAGSTR